ncbi:MAG: hypothetical protein U5L72_18085 [Bacteroidales bacterium]|nr:hypothetical protein [Bacteroidales bacterium]
MSIEEPVLVRGPLGIYNGVPSLVEKFGEASDYSALMIRKETGIPWRHYGSIPRSIRECFFA